MKRFKEEFQRRILKKSFEKLYLKSDKTIWKKFF